METCAVDVVVTGRVQGVFFRARTAQAAERHGVTGWVRNERDGSVSAHFEGPRDAVDALVAWCGSGPPGAVVDGVRSQPAEVVGVREFRVVD